jgi:hypothetical protein
MGKLKHDIEEWEKTAWLWIEDVANKARAWERLTEIQMVSEPLEQFIERLEKTKWMKHRKKHHHGHHPYDHDDY